jgi:ABC-2 type transport system permease protein
MIASIGYGSYSPLSVPGLYSGAGGEYKSQLNLGNYLVLILTIVIGYFATLLYW